MKNARRILVRGVVAGCLLGIYPAGAGQETFDGTGLSNSWVDGGSFTGQAGVVWTYAHARGYPTVYTNDPSITLRTGSTATKGWLQSPTLTGGVGSISAAFMQELTGAVDCDIWAGDVVIGNYVSAGTQGGVQVAVFEAVDPATRLPVTNDFVLMLSNRLATAGAVAVDDLQWTPFRLFVRLDQTGTNTAYAGVEFDAFAEVFDVGQTVTGGWSIEPVFAGAVTDTNSLHWTLIPDNADIGQVFTLTYAAADSETNHSAHFQMEVVEAPNPRFVNFEEASFGYDTNSGVVTNLNGMNWIFLNARTSDSTDRKLDAVSSRFRHTTALPASMESQDSFTGIGTVSLHYAHYGSNRVVTFDLQVHGDGEDWTTVSNGTFSVEDHDDITNSVFSVDVQRQGETWLRLLTTGNANEIANIDDIRIREYGDTLPRLVWSGETTAPLGRESVLDFTLLNAEAIARTWSYSLLPGSANAVFEVTPADQLQFRFSPQATNEWGEYTVNASASIGGEVAGETSLVIQVVSAPTFALAPAATNLTVPDIVDVWVTNVVLHGTNLTEWTTEWEAQPLFVHATSVSNKSRFRIAAGTAEIDAGDHVLTAVLTDLGTGVMASNAVVLTVTGSGGDITNEVYSILSFGLTNVVVSGRVGRVFRAFGTTNLPEGVGETNWSWQGESQTNTDGADMNLELPAAPDPRLFFYGVRVRAAP